MKSIEVSAKDMYDLIVNNGKVTKSEVFKLAFDYGYETLVGYTDWCFGNLWVGEVWENSTIGWQRFFTAHDKEDKILFTLFACVVGDKVNFVCFSDFEKHEAHTLAIENSIEECGTRLV